MKYVCIAVLMSMIMHAGDDPVDRPEDAVKDIRINMQKKLDNSDSDVSVEDSKSISGGSGSKSGSHSGSSSVPRLDLSNPKMPTTQSGILPGSLTPSRISTMQQLKEVSKAMSKRYSPKSGVTKPPSARDLEIPDIDHTVAANVIYTITYKKEAPTDPSQAKTLNTLTRTIGNLDLEERNRLMQGILFLGTVLDGDITPTGVRKRKEQKQSQVQAPKKVSKKNQHKEVTELQESHRATLERQATMAQEIKEQEDELKDIRRMMREISLQASENDAERAEKAEKRADKADRRNLILGVATIVASLAGAAIGALPTYYSVYGGATSAPGTNCTGS